MKKFYHSPFGLIAYILGAPFGQSTLRTGIDQATRHRNQSDRMSNLNSQKAPSRKQETRTYPGQIIRLTLRAREYEWPKAGLEYSEIFYRGESRSHVSALRARGTMEPPQSEQSRFTFQSLRNRNYLMDKKQACTPVYERHVAFDGVRGGLSMETKIASRKVKFIPPAEKAFDWTWLVQHWCSKRRLMKDWPIFGKHGLQTGRVKSNRSGPEAIEHR